MPREQLSLIVLVLMGTSLASSGQPRRQPVAVAEVSHAPAPILIGKAFQEYLDLKVEVQLLLEHFDSM